MEDCSLSIKAVFDILKADNRIAKIRFLFYSWQIDVYVMGDIIVGGYVMGDMGGRFMG